MPDETRALCRRQHELFDQARPLPAWAAQLALQPLLNIPRQLISEGRGQDAHAMLETLYRAARERTTAVIDSLPVDLTAVTSAPDDHKTVCTVIWAALLADGTRALALAGRWKEAARYAAAHRGTGQRLLDGRQATILALDQDGQPQRGRHDGRGAASIAEPWERTVQSLLRVLCQPNGRHCHQRAHRGDACPRVRLAQEQDPSTAVMRTRAGMIALDLAGTSDDPRSLRCAQG